MKNIAKLEVTVNMQGYYRLYRDIMHCYYRGAVHRICNLKYRVPKKIRIVFHNGSNYDYHFIIK